MTEPMRAYFIIERGEYTGRNWCLAFGRSMIDNQEYTITTNCVNGSNVHNFIKDGKDDAELVCKLLNMYFNGLIEINNEVL